MPGDLVKFPFGCVPDDWRVFFVGYFEKGRQGSHVKRVMTRFDSRCVHLFTEFKTAHGLMRQILCPGTVGKSPTICGVI